MRIVVVVVPAVATPKPAAVVDVVYGVITTVIIWPTPFIVPVVHHILIIWKRVPAAVGRIVLAVVNRNRL